MRQKRKIRDIKDGETFFLSEKARTPYVSQRGYETALGMGGYDERWPYIEYWRKDGKGKRKKDFSLFMLVWVDEPKKNRPANHSGFRGDGYSVTGL